MAIRKIYSSDISRAKKTAEIVQDELKKLGIETNLRIRDMFSYTNPKYFPPEINEERMKIKDSGKPENEFVKDFLNGKWKNKPETLAKPYIKILEQIFDRINRVNKQFSIIAFRHGDKSSDGELSDLGKENAKLLGQRLSKDKSNEDIILIATHNTINESIVRCLIDNNLPDKWREPLGFTETVKYTFYTKKKDSEPYLEIEWRDIKRKIPYKGFKDTVKNLTE